MYEKLTLKDHREYAWNYFKVHAQQRMSLFNFFVVFSSIVITGLVGTFQERIQAHLVGAGLGVLVVLVSFVFWKLDKRVGFLIKHAESALKWIEKGCPSENCDSKTHIMQLFIREETRTESERRAPWYAPWRRHLTYASCFRLAFLAFGLIGLVGTVISLILWFSEMRDICH